MNTGASHNPVATEAQRQVEDRALALLERPELKRVRAVVRLLWENVAAWPARDQSDRFDNMIEEYLFHHAMRAANSDPHHPEVARFMVPPHRWYGRDVPGSRWAGDSPDFIYRIIPIAHGGRYEIHGKPTCTPAPTVNYSLMGDQTAAPVTLALLDSLDMVFEGDGGFTITVDDTPADGRPNHIQTRPGAEFLMIRDALGDWLQQSANALSVRRLNPSTVRRGEDAMAQHAAKIAIQSLYYTYYCTQSGNGQPPNHIRQPQSSGAFGGMATQWGTKGNLDLGPHEALIVTANSAGALFRNVMLTDQFHMSLNYWSRQSSLNMCQMAADSEGRFTYVVAHQDPGVYNWLDTNGLQRTIFGHRWQAFLRAAAAETPTLSVREVKFRDINATLPPGVRRIDAAVRARQIAQRQAGFSRRFSED
jgi:hypothetical protein